MRNLIWSGTAMVLLAGVGLFVAGQHAVHHPNSFVGRCATTIYHMWDAEIVPRGDTKAVEEFAQAPHAPSTVVAGSTPVVEVLEPIVVEPTDQEPPLASPRLSPEIADAIERLRSEEESEAPPKSFDGTGHALYMPYADEELEVLPLPSPRRKHSEIEVNLPGTHGFFTLAPCCLQMVLDKVIDSLRRLGQTQDDLAEPADEGTSDDETAAELPPASYHTNHPLHCPYTGSYPSSYQVPHELPAIRPAMPSPK